jgi:hypothetical protein
VPGCERCADDEHSNGNTRDDPQPSARAARLERRLCSRRHELLDGSRL